jgi:hypothetical protein
MYLNEFDITHSLFRTAEGENSMVNRPLWQALLWFIAGGLIGLGLLAFDIYFIFIPCVIAGICLLIFEIRRWGPGQLWLAFLGFGVVPALLLLNSILSSFPTCPPEGLTIPPDAPPGTTLSCGGPLPSTYYVLLACFAGIALAALMWPILRRIARR